MTMRITGIASGLDSDSIISALVAAKKVPIDNIKKKVDEEEIQVKAYTNLQTLANALEEAANKLTLSSTWNSKSASSSKSDVMTASATASASLGTYSVDVSSLATSEIVRGTSQTAHVGNYTGSFTINGVDVSVSNKTLAQVATAINTASNSMETGKKVNAYILNNTLVIQKQDTGSTVNADGTDNSNAISFAEVSGSLLQTLGVLNASGEKIDKDSGTDLAATINGVAITSASNTISTISGVTISVASEGKSTITVGNDSSKIEKAITDFLSAYNAITSYVDKTTTVTTTSDGEAVSSGVLQGQFYPTSLQTKLFQYMSSVVSSGEINDKYDNLYSIGIKRDDDTGFYSITDESALTSALTSNFEDIKNLFMGGDSRGYYGIAKTMDSYLNDTILNKLDGSLPNIIEQTNSLISTNNDRITELNTSLLSYETNLYSHFSYMENMVQSWNSQLKYLLSELGLSS